jgi:hypothetical protein
MVRRFLIIVFALTFAACAATLVQPKLSSAEATRLGASKARSDGYDLRQYARPLVTYVPDEKLWWVNYRRKNAKYTQFSIRIDDKTKKPTLVLP